MSNQYFTIQENYQEKFYRLPKVFFTNPKYIKLKNDSKIAYSILQDRLELSIRNKWVDQSGRIFFIYTDKKLAEILNISKNHVTTVKKELIEAELLIQKRQGLNKPNISYLLKPAISQDDIYMIESEETDLEVSSGKDSHTVGIQNHTQWESRITHSGNLESHTVGTNDTDFIDTDFNKTELSDTTTTQNQKTSSSSNTLKLIKKLENEFNIKITTQYKKSLINLFDQLDTDIIEYAIEYTSLNATSPKQYLVSILENWINADIKTVEQAKSFKQVTKSKQKLESKEITPQWLLDRKEQDNKENEMTINQKDYEYYQNVKHELDNLIKDEFEKDLQEIDGLNNDVKAICDVELNKLSDEEKQECFENKQEFIKKKIEMVSNIIEFKKDLIQKWG